MDYILEAVCDAERPWRCAETPLRTGRDASRPIPRECGVSDDGRVSWAGFQARGGPYTSRSSGRPSKGNVSVFVTAPAGDDDRVPPSKDQAAAYR